MQDRPEPALADESPCPGGDATARDGASPIDDPDRDIVQLFTSGDGNTALRLLMARHGRSVYRFCREALRDRALADDVHQQVFIAAHRDLASFAGRSTVRTWLFAIANHRVLDAAKARRRLRAHLEPDNAADAADPAPPPDEQLDEATLTSALIECIGKLSAAARAALLLRYQQGFTFEAMAKLSGDKAGTLQARVMRALPVLRACIERRTGRSP